MIVETVQSDELIPPEYEMTAKEYRDFQNEYARWCVEVELANIKVLDNKESRND